MLWIFGQIVFAWYYGLLAEWLIHKYVLHQYGTKKKSIWSFHFKEHHAISRRNGNLDEGYFICKNSIKWNRVGKELFALAILGAIHTPLFFVAPFFVITVWFSIVQYYYLHSKSHVDIEWAKKHLPWHYEHHMGKNQHMNWGVRSDFFDKVFGTRRHYLKEKK